MTDAASADAILQLLLAMGALLQAVAGFLIFLSSYIALFLLVVICFAAADLIYRAVSWISARSAKTALLARTAVARFELRSKATHA